MRSKAVSTLAVLLAIVCCSHSFADTINPERVTWDLSSLAMDVDYAALPMLFGPDSAENPTTNSWSATGWSSSVGGSYLGNAIDFAYSGQYNADTGALSWTGSGTLGSTSLTSSAAGTFSGNTFTVSGSGSLGSHAWTWDGVYTYSSDLLSLSGPMTDTLDGEASSDTYSLAAAGGGWRISSMHKGKYGFVIMWNRLPPPPPPGGGGGGGGVGPTTVPEPSSLALAIIGSLACLIYAAYRRKEIKK